MVPAFVAAVLSQLGDRSAWLVAILSDRYQRPFTVALAALLAHAAGNVIAAAGGVYIAPLLTPNTKQLLTALALAFAAFGALWPTKAPDRLNGWRLGPLVTPLLGVFILALGDTTQFFTFVFAAKAGWLAVVGASSGAFAVALGAALLGEPAWRKLPLHWLRIGVGIVAIGMAAILAATALRLI